MTHAISFQCSNEGTSWTHDSTEATLVCCKVEACAVHVLTVAEAQTHKAIACATD